MIIIITTPINIPGIIPAANNDAIEISVALASTIIMILGGMIPPIVELTPVTAAEKAAGYPAFFMAGNTSAPTVAVSATTEPFMPAKNMLTRTLTWAKPPRIRPINALLKATKRSVIVALVISSPVNIKNAIAVKGTESIALNI